MHSKSLNLYSLDVISLTHMKWPKFIHVIAIRLREFCWAGYYYNKLQPKWNKYCRNIITRVLLNTANLFGAVLVSFFVLAQSKIELSDKLSLSNEIHWNDFLKHNLLLCCLCGWLYFWANAYNNLSGVFSVWTNLKT